MKVKPDIRQAQKLVLKILFNAYFPFPTKKCLNIHIQQKSHFYNINFNDKSILVFEFWGQKSVLEPISTVFLVRKLQYLKIIFGVKIQVFFCKSVLNQ